MSDTENQNMNQDSAGQNETDMNQAGISQNEADMNQNENVRDATAGKQNRTGLNGTGVNPDGSDGRNSDNGQQDINYNYKTPEFSRRNTGGSNRQDTGYSYRDSRSEHTEEASGASGGGQAYHQRPDFGQPQDRGTRGRKKSEHGIGRELGIFAAKCGIAAVIGVVVLGLAGTIALNATKKNVYIVGQNSSWSGSGRSDRQLPDFGSNNGNGSQMPGNGSNDNNDNNNNSGNNQGRSGSDGNNNSGSGSSQAQNDSDGPKLGVTVETVSDDMVSSGYPAGVLIRDVTKGSAADKAGLKAGDIITSFNGTVVKSTDELVEQVKDVNDGDTVRIVYKRLENEQYKAENADVKMTSSTSDSESASSSGNS